MKITKVLCAGALLITNLAYADLIAKHLHAVNKQDGLIVELSDLQRPESQKEASTCEKQGKRMVFISATDTKMFPRTLPYASGCWFDWPKTSLTSSGIASRSRLAELTHLMGLRACFDIASIMPVWAYFRQLAGAELLATCECFRQGPSAGPQRQWGDYTPAYQLHG